MPQFDTHFLTPLIFWSLISFGLLLGLLSKFVLPPLIAGLEERKKTIKGNLEQAEQMKKDAEQLLIQYREKLKRAAEEAEKILAETQQSAQRLLEENQQRIGQETERMIAEARQEILREQQKAMNELKRYVVNLTLLVTEKVLRRTLNDSDNLRLIEESVEEFAAQDKTRLNR
ncbi:MAG TPA: F0F1 ATP synthase subunit B [Nitrospiria bacterium]|jgi:F-type H+-transporting ATPase subunit b|nr:F0F1 ATP synthase subunit B [Nitrospiria bacterium]